MLNKWVLTLCVNLLVISVCFSQEKTASEILKKAEQNIEQYRKGDARISFMDNTGNPVRDAEIEIKQVSQDFLFGNIIPFSDTVVFFSVNDD